MNARTLFLSLLISFSASLALAQQPLAPTPPMGWNSWDSYNENINEQQVRANAEKMAKELKPHGYQYVVIDEGWYLVDLDQRTKAEESKFALDADGRFIPDAVRYPSSANGAGLKPLADYMHSLGLKFGVHILRGIPREAVARNLPIAGSSFHAADAADQTDACGWNTYNWGVKNNAAGQAYYDSLAKQFAGWGLDFLKVDCIADHPFKADEIRMLSTALRKSGRDIVLSLSPGPTAVENADYMARYAEMWRISNDIWDHWGTWPHFEWSQSLLDQFTNAANWAGRVKPGAWPDADMLPFGYLGPHAGAGETRQTRLTQDEQRTMMTLWAIFRSPLIMGGDLLSLDDWTRSLLTNDDVIAVDQHSTGNRPVLREHDIVIWTARPESGKGYYVAAFNLGDKEQDAQYPWRELGLPAPASGATDLWEHKALGTMPELHVTVKPHASVLWKVE